MENLIKPNFFVFGSPKCGSSAFCDYLAAHPEICFSNKKEVNHFNTDFRSTTTAPPTDTAAYLERYFAACGDETVVGEGSVKYIFSAVAAKHIASFNPAAKLIIIVRQPVDMFLSQYYQKHAGDTDPAKTPEAAWRAQFSRDNSEPENHELHYARICSAGANLARVYEHFPTEQVLVIFYEDFRDNPHQVWQTTQTFLGVKDDGRTEFPVVNKSRATSSEWLRHGLQVLRRIKKKLGITAGIGNTRLVQSIIFGKKKPLSPAFRQELQDYFQDDIALLAQLTGRDLSRWQR